MELGDNDDAGTSDPLKETKESPRAALRGLARMEGVPLVTECPMGSDLL